MRLPEARGPLSAEVVSRLAGPVSNQAFSFPAGSASADDAAIAMWTIYELHYRGFDGVDDRWEWAPALSPVRFELEEALEHTLRSRYCPPPRTADLAADLFAMVSDHAGPSVARHVQHRATLDEVRHLVRQRSIYHLKEADPTSWVLPRLEAAPKAALMEIQFDEYGAGRPERLHHLLFQRGMADLGLDPAYGAYIDEATTEVLEQNNALSLMGLHRRLRAAALGHLAAFEATSSLPSKRMCQGLERVGLTGGLVDYYAEHVLADAVHDQLAVRAVCVPLAREDEALADDVFFGAFTCLDRGAYRPRPAEPLGRRRMTATDGSPPSAGDQAPGADIVLCPGGPMLVRGDVVIEDADGVRHRTSRPVSAVCRCTKSAQKPWCDGTHQVLPAHLRP